MMRPISIDRDGQCLLCIIQHKSNGVGLSRIEERFATLQLALQELITRLSERSEKSPTPAEGLMTGKSGAPPM